MNDQAILAFLLFTATTFWLHIARDESSTFWKIAAVALALFSFVSAIYVNFSPNGISEP